MAEPIREDDGILQEWESETQLLIQIPLKIQRGIFSRNLNLTCVDAVSEYIALGTNCGLIYWYCRPTSDLQRLHFENSNSIVTCVKIVSTVDYMVAAGTNGGNVTVFQIPKILPESLPQTLKPKKNQIERFSIDGLHTAPVTVIEWSKNGMKLFSGDKNGLVVLTEIDFYMHLSKSMELLNEQFEIVQLSYDQQTLLISSTFRCITCDGLNKWKVHQVGTKERKMLGAYGGTFCNLEHELVIYASRPGQRLWLANTSGMVQKTLLFKTAISSSYPKIQLINPVSKIEYSNMGFGRLKPFGEKLIAYNSEIMYVLDPNTISIVSGLDSARGIIDLAVNNDEIFILEEERSLLRIAYEPDGYCKYSGTAGSRRKSFIFDEFASKLKDTAMESLKKITSELVVTPEQMSPNSPPILADEALNLPPIVNLPSGSVSTIIPENVEEHFSIEVNEIRGLNTYLQNNRRVSNSESSRCDDDLAKCMGCDELISRPLRRRNPKKSRVVTVLHGQESESDTTSNASDDRLVWSIANELSFSEESKASLSRSQSSFSILRDIPIMLATNHSKTTGSELFCDEASRMNDDKSQISLDTCESVSERLRITPEKFSEEQEKTFFRLANQDLSLLDSYNSEKTDNMSISLNMTPSSSVSSKISDNAQSNSETSENVSMMSDDKTENSASTSTSQNDVLPLPRHLCFYIPHDNTERRECNHENKSSKSPYISVSNEDSRQPDVGTDYPLSRAIPDDLFTPGKNYENSLYAEDKPNNRAGEYCSVEIEKETRGVNFDCTYEVRNMVLTKSEEILDRSGNELPNDILEGNMLCQEKLSEQKINNTDYSSAESISYGPPSGSSTLERNSILDQSFSVDYACRPQINIELSDQWLQYLAPAPIVCLAVSSSYIVCVDNKGQVNFSGLSGLSLSWNPLTYKASWIGVSNSGSIVWILNKKNVFSLVNPSKKGPFADDILQQNFNIKHFAIDNQNPEGWMIKLDGQIGRQRNLLGAPVGKLEHIPCDWLLTSVACWNGIVLAITSDGSVVCKPSNEERFRSVMTPTIITNCVELGPDNLAWVVDDRNNIYFSDDFLSENSHWWEILISEYVFQNASSMLQNIQNRFKVSNLGERINVKVTMVASNETSVWVFDKFSATLKVNKTAVTGYMWNKTNLSLNLPLVKWHFICANGVSDLKGHFWLLSSCGDLFGSTPNSKNFQSVSTPFGEIRCISSSSDVLWVLSTDGVIYSRLGLNDKNLIGSSWKELPLTEEEEESRFIWISCGRNAVWSCDVRGRIYVTTESPLHISTKLADFQWLKVGGEPKEGALFEKVFAGANLRMVWAVDNKQNIYFREGIFPHFQVGTGWVYVSGLQATMITVSRSSVWALASNGFIYRRYGITESNCIGDYWRRIPGLLKFFSSSCTDELWGINHNSEVLKLFHKTKIFAKKKVFLNEILEPASLNEAEKDWEIPEDFSWSCNSHC